jgi:hypothetical protein
LLVVLSKHLRWSGQYVLSMSIHTKHVYACNHFRTLTQLFPPAVHEIGRRGTKIGPFNLPSCGLRQGGHVQCCQIRQLGRHCS